MPLVGRARKPLRGTNDAKQVCAERSDTMRRKNNRAKWPNFATECNEARTHGAARCTHADMNWSTAAGSKRLDYVSRVPFLCASVKRHVRLHDRLVYNVTLAPQHALARDFLTREHMDSQHASTR